MANSVPSQGSGCSPRWRGSESILLLSRDPQLPCMFHTMQRSPPRAKITWQPHGTGCPATSSFDFSNHWIEHLLIGNCERAATENWICMTLVRKPWPLVFMGLIRQFSVSVPPEAICSPPHPTPTTKALVHPGLSTSTKRSPHPLSSVVSFPLLSWEQYLFLYSQKKLPLFCSA